MRDRYHTWQWLISWIERMTIKHGGVVFDGPKKLDWGQAACRAAYGPNWMLDDEFRKFDETPDKPVPDYVIDVCKRWEAGEWPEWASNNTC